MWCKQCRQDVPGVSAAGQRKLRCVRCGTLMRGDTTAASIHVAKGVGSSADHGLELTDKKPDSPERPVEIDDWDLDPELRSLPWMRAMQAGHAAAGMPKFDLSSFAMPPIMGVPQAQANAQWQMPAGMQTPLGMPMSYGVPHSHGASHSTSSKPKKRHPGQRGAWMAWFVMAIGVMAFTCGAVLIGWSMVTERTDLWDLGLPVTVAGQIALLIGLILQLERMWQNNRYAVNKLDEVDSRLADIKHTQSLLGVNHASPGQAFYAHLAGGGNPSMLLADLKGQLDLLAVKIAERG